LKTFLFALQFLTSIALILSVLLHPAKTMGMGGMGSPSEIFGSQKGAEDGLNKITAVIGLIWSLTAVFLTIIINSGT